MVVMLAAVLVYGHGAQDGGAGHLGRAAIRLEAAGAGEGFAYERAEGIPGVYAVTFNDTGESVLVSDSFLNLILQSDMAPDVQVLALEQYPEMVVDNFAAIVESTFPVQDQALPDSFQAIECQGRDGSFLTAEQDNLARPYVRITVKDPLGRIDTFSLSRQYVDNVLAQPDADADSLLAAVTTFTFRLPERARMGFSYLARDQLNDLIMQTPEFQRQEIVRMPRFYREKAPELLQRLSNRPPQVVREPPAAAVVLPAPPPVARPPRAPTGVTAAPAPPPPTAAPAPLPERGKPFYYWFALAGWGVAAIALLWALRRRA